MSGAELAIILRAVDQASGPLRAIGGALREQRAGWAQLGTVGRAALGGVTLAVGALAGGLGASVAAAAGFEEKLSAVRAVSGATAQEMDKLSGLALQLGKDTAFSASAAAAGIEELVKGGLTIPDIMNGAAEATLNLAAAGGVSLPDAATIAANALAQFNLKGEDMAHVADLIAGAANASAIDVMQFKDSLAQSGAIAATVGFSFDDLAVAIAVMGKAGITGADAGTSLKTMMMNLVPQTDKAAGLMKELGLMTYDTARLMEIATNGGIRPLSDSLPHVWKAAVAAHAGLKDVGEVTAKHIKDFSKASQELGIMSNKFFDAKGNVKSMAEVADILQESMANLTKEEQIKALRDLFGFDAVRAATVLAKEGAAGFERMAAAMGKVTAADVAKIRLDNLAGDLEQLGSSWETLQITIGERLQPALRDATQWLTGLVNAAIPWVNEHGPRFVALLSQVGSVIPLVVDSVRTFVGALQGDWQPAPGIAQFHLIVGQIGQTIGSVRDGVITFLAALQGDWQPAPGITQFHLAAGQVGLAVRDAAAAVQGLIAAAGGLLSALQENTLVMSVLVGLTAAVATGYGLATAAKVAHTVASAAETAAIWALIVADNVAAAATGAWTAAQWLLNAALTANPIGIIVVALAALAAGLIYAYNNSEEFRAIVDAAFAAVVAAGQALIGWVSGLPAVWEAAMAAVGAAVGGASSAIQSSWAAAQSATQSAQDAIQAKVAEVWNAIPEDIRADLELIGATLLDRLTAQVATVATALGEIQTTTSTTWAAVAATVSARTGEVGAVVSAHGSALATTVRDTLAAVWSAVSTTWSAISAATSTTWEAVRSAVAGKVAEALGAVRSWASALVGRLRELIGEARAAAGAVGQAIVDGIKDAIRRGVDAIKDAAAGAARAALRAAKEALGISSPSRLFAVQVGQPIVQGILAGLDAGQPALDRALATLAAPAGARAPLTAAGAGAGAGAGGLPMTVVLELDGRELTRALLPYLPGEVVRVGGSF